MCLCHYGHRLLCADDHSGLNGSLWESDERGKNLVAHYGNPEQLELLLMNIDRRGKVKTKEKGKDLTIGKDFVS